MESTSKLVHNLSSAEENTDRLDQKVENVQDLLESTHEKLEISEDINSNLRKLNTSLDTASDLLLVISIIPSIGSPARKLKSTLDKFNAPIKKAKKASDAMEEKIKPLRKFIKKCEEKTEKLDQAILKVNNSENQFISALTSAQGCIATLPESDGRTDLDKTLDSLSSKVDPSVIEFDKIQKEILKGVTSIEKKFDTLEKELKKLTDVNRALVSAINAIAPLIAAMRAISKVFKQTIKVPYGGYPKMCKKRVWGVKVYYPCGWHTEYFRFSIKQILEGVSGVIKPVMRLLDKAMDAVLDPLLKTLNLDITLPKIPYVDKLSGIFKSIEGVMDPIKEMVDAMEKQYKKYKALMDKIEAEIDKVRDIFSACQLQERKG